MNSKAIYCDVVFPLRLGILTYLIPEELQGKIQSGYLVEAPLRKGLKRGVVLRLREGYDDGAMNIKKIVNAFPFLGEGLLKLLEWMSGYYLAEEGTILRSMVPSFIFRRKRLALPTSINLSSLPAGSSYSASLFMGDILKTGKLVKLLEDAERGAIVLVPSVEMAEKVYKNIEDSFKERLLFFHSKLKSSELMSNYIKLLLDSERLSPIVIGTRNAVFSPFKPSMIIVIDEASSSYKEEESPSFNVRDIAVMRAYIDKIPVFLSSLAPSLESIYNARLGKYKLIKEESKKKRVSITINRLKKKNTEVDLISERLLKKIEMTLKKDEKIILSLPRTGYSFIYCNDCGKILRCECEGIFIFYKGRKHLKCRLCDNEINLPSLCPYCGGTGLGHFSSGIERIEEFVKERFSSFSLSDSLEGVTISPSPRFISKEDFYLGVILDADIFLNMPDYRASERLFQEVYYLLERLKEGGEIILQTRMPEYRIFNYIKRLDYMGFALSELKMRREHNLPPFSRLLIIRLFSKKMVDEGRIFERFKASGASIRKILLKKRKKARGLEIAFLLRIDRNVDIRGLKEIIRTLRQEGIELRTYMD